MAKKHVIIGAGPAGLSAMEKMRSLNHDDEIKLLTGENCLPYSPTALPYLLSGMVKEHDLWLRNEAYFEKMDVTFATDCEVVQVLPDKRQVIYRNGEGEQYDDLLIATGAAPQVPDIEGLEGGDLLVFHTLTDYHALRERIGGRREIAILGAGMVAVELAIALSELGHPVKIITRGPPLRVYFDRQVQQYITDIFKGHGIDVFTGKPVSRVTRQAEKVAIACADGEVFGADLVVSCLGVAPRVDFLAGSGVRVDQGIVVDDRMQTTREAVYAAGDCAEGPDFFSHRPGRNAIVPSAVSQGQVAGANMAGLETHNEGWIAMNTLNLFGNLACSIGMVMPLETGFDVVEEKDDASRSFKRLVFCDGRLVGAMFLNTAVNPGVIAYLIEKRVDIGKHKPLLMQKVQETSLWLMLEAERALSRVTEG